jgi:hypothetical protein
VKKKKPKKKPLRVVADPVINATTVTPETHAADPVVTPELAAIIERDKKQALLKRAESEALEDAVEEADLDGFVAIEIDDRNGHDVEDTLLVALLQEAPSDAPEAPAAAQALLKGHAVQVAPPSNGNGHATYLDEPSDLAALLPSRR